MVKEDSYLYKIADFCISKSKIFGSTDVSVLVKNSISENISFRNKKLDGSERAENLSVILTTYIGKKKASISSTNLSDNNLTELVEKCVDATKVTPEDEYNSLPDKELHFEGDKNLELYDNTHIENNKKVSFIKEAEETAFINDKIVNTNGSGFSEIKSNFVLANSNGFSDGYKTSQFTAYCEVVAKNNGSMERDYEYSSKRYFDDLIKPKEIGENAAKLAISKLNPKKIESNRMDVIFDKRIAQSILSSFASAISSSTIAKGTTFLKNSLNKQVFTKEINVIDKGDIKKANGSRYFDSEGVKVQELELISKGILKDYLTETYNGKKINRKSNGRSSGTTNLFFENGKNTFNELINSNKKILYITETIGRGSNIITGDYSVGASGIIIENGKFTYPVSEITIAGNFNEMFMNISLANDLEFKYSTNSPTMLISGMTIGGK
ncbi:MAG: protein for maturation of antibiotic MccB17 [Candidatus Pelagibacter sp.]|nr:protein for maturation of antibiotic MccB17 [Candidatus Pelagibacter sp.]